MLERPAVDRRRRATYRQRRYRARQRSGVVTAIVELDGEVLDLLVRLQWLQESAVADRRAIGKAISAMLRDTAG